MLRLGDGNWRLVGAPDLGRLHLGYPPGGPHDRYSCALANRMLGNDSFAGAVEMTMVAPSIRVLEDGHLVFGGAPVEVVCDGEMLARWRVHKVRAGSSITVRFLGIGCRVYLCAGGGLEQGPGGWGEHLNNVSSPPKVAVKGALPRLPRELDWTPAPGRLRVVAGPECLPELEEHLCGPWGVEPDSDGMGVRLAGMPVPLGEFNITSAPTQDGTVQATSQGLIALLRERGTLGGYPRVASVIDADVDRLAQLRPGERVHFDWVDAKEAKRVAAVQREALEFLIGE